MTRSARLLPKTYIRSPMDMVMTFQQGTCDSCSGSQRFPQIRFGNHDSLGNSSRCKSLDCLQGSQESHGSPKPQTAGHREQMRKVLLPRLKGAKDKNSMRGSCNRDTPSQPLGSWELPKYGSLVHTKNNRRADINNSMTASSKYRCLPIRVRITQTF